ncbi:MAG: ribosome recycling factor [Clostridia bacterium]|nr:ribosome recycling factor [Clostridia bacterium]
MLNKDDYNQFIEKMDKTISFLKEQMNTVRAGRANPAILDRITVQYYGTDTPINQIAGIAVPEARLLVITPWDGSALKEIEKAIQKSDIGINPQNDGKSIKLIFPPLTEERRLQLTKLTKTYGEDAKTAVRNVRREAVEFFKNQKKKSIITEDEQKDSEKEIQNFTDKHIAEIDKVVAAKDKELMEI